MEDLNNHCIAFCKEFHVEVLQSSRKVHHVMPKSLLYCFQRDDELKVLTTSQNISKQSKG